MREFATFYDFFKLPEEEAAAMIGHPFREAARKHKNKIIQNKTLYFPIGLSDKWENYGYATGLIFVSPVWPETPNYPKWFRCALASPDDGDVDLDFEGEEIIHRPAVLEFMHSMPFEDTSIREVLEMVQHHVKAGSLNGKKYIG